ncbi:RnfH family protein [Neisseriaceae bacterium ESL0693]|nr:RnfH family protein [Neisseriaceae bacterium ESL0693]
MNKITVEAVYATPEKQYLWQGEITEGLGARAVLLQSALPQVFHDVDFHYIPIGIFGKQVADDYIVQAGDRIEAYRPLLIDPKENRRRRALKK